MKLQRGLAILWQRLRYQGIRTTLLWAADHAVRILSGSPIRAVSEIGPGLHVGGQYRHRGWRRLRTRGISAVVNMRAEFDDQTAGIAPARYLYLPTIDDEAPTLEQMRAGVDFVAGQLKDGGGVYIHCKSGVGRAAIMAAAYLTSTGLTPEDAWSEIRKVRPFIRPTAVQIDQLERFVVEAGTPE
jgi:protein tyrosine phosphatase (PTP) superfamily phosphohydrolase (DUF442 family)